MTMLYRRIILLIALGLTGTLLLGCSSTASLPEAAETAAEAPPAHTLIYIIHGDGSYLYHENGIAHRADQKALAEARLVAEHAPEMEVFIFHQRPRRSLLGLFPRSDGSFYHYRDGELVTEQTYHRQPEGSGLSKEALLYDVHRHPDDSPRTLLYYGHDLEEEGGERYHASHLDHPFGLDQFVDGLALFEAEEEPFELIVLSTCNNGTPGTVAAVAPLTRYVLASPENLHLSYIDSHPLHGVGTSEGGIERLATKLAEWAYQRLTTRTETAVTLALYDTEQLKPLLQEMQPVYEAALAGSSSNAPRGLAEFVDCRDGALPALDDSVPGVKQWYRPPAFGPDSRKESHSGWGCPAVAPPGDGETTSL